MSTDPKRQEVSLDEEDEFEEFQEEGKKLWLSCCLFCRSCCTK